MWFQDEARIGQKNSLTRVWEQTGSRPAAPKGLGFASAYVFGAVCPVEGKAAALIMPVCNTAAMNHHLSEISSQVAADAHAVVILDRAGWHRSQGLVVPANITLLELPPYSPELNPVERIWHFLDRSVPSISGRIACTYGAGEAGAQATAQSERIRPWLVANRFQAVSQASMTCARLANTELASGCSDCSVRWTPIVRQPDEA